MDSAPEPKYLPPWKKQDLPETKTLEDNSPKTVIVASIQFASEMGKIQRNISGLTPLIEEAAAKGAKIIVLPETSITGYLSQDLRTNWQLPHWPLDVSYWNSMDPSEFAETIPGPSTEYFTKLALRLGVYVTVPLLEVDKTDPKDLKYYNSVCLASPSGAIVTSYRYSPKKQTNILEKILLGLFRKNHGPQQVRS